MNWKQFLETKGISLEDYAKKSVEEMAQLQGEFQTDIVKSLEEDIAKASTKVEVKTVADSLEAYKTELTGLKIKESLEELTQKVAELKENSKGGMSLNTVKAQIGKFITDNHDEIKKINKQGSGLVEITLKVVGDITTGSATNPDGIPELVGTQIAPPSNINLRGTFVDSLVTNVNTSLSAYPYTETVPKEGGYEFLAEGAIKPQIDFKIETRYATPVKTASWIKLTDESVQDIVGLQSIANDLLRKKHDLKKQNGILFGDGIAPNPKGATVYGRTFVAGAMALAVTNPNIMDVINACVTDVYDTHNYEDEESYMPSLAVLNPVDFFVQFVSAKNADGNPLYPTASLFNRVNIGGLTIIPERSIPAGKIFVADMSKYNTTNYVGYTVKIGYVNDDFIKNQFVILGESRFHAFVKRLDEQAFIYDDIATIKAAITAV